MEPKIWLGHCFIHILHSHCQTELPITSLQMPKTDIGGPAHYLPLALTTQAKEVEEGHPADEHIQPLVTHMVPPVTHLCVVGSGWRTPCLVFIQNTWAHLVHDSAVKRVKGEHGENMSTSLNF